MNLLLAFIVGLSAAPARAAEIIGAIGDVQVMSGGGWTPVRGAPFALEAGALIRTGSSSMARVKLDDGSTIQLLSSAQFSLEQSQSRSVSISLSLGLLRAWVKKAATRQFQVRTPTAVASVRGTTFEVEVDESKAVRVAVESGLVGVKTILGETIDVGAGSTLSLLPSGQRADAVERGVKPARTAVAEKRAAGGGLEEFKKDAQREVALGLAKDAVQAAAAVEARSAEYQEGKTLIDVNGHRVRLEEYIVRPAADQFKFVVLNERSDRFDYFYYQAKFNQSLPENLSLALRYLNGKTGSAPTWYVTDFETGRSNTVDTVQEIGAGGHLVSSPLASDTVVYDPDTNSFATVSAGTSFWKTLFNNYSYRINGTEKYGWSPMNTASNVVNAYDYTADGIRTRMTDAAGTGMVTCLTLACELASRPSTVTQPDGSSALHDRVTINYLNGTKETYDFYVIDDEGRLADTSDFSNIANGVEYKNALLRFNYQQVITASEFNGRKIDLVVEPKILIKSGVIQ